MKHKLLSILLCLAMALSLLPTAALADGEETSQAEGSEQKTYVAKIRDKQYETLQAAIDAAKGGDTIVLKKSISATEIGEKKQLQFEKEAMNLTLDLNQNTITAEAGEAIAVNAANITLIVKNGTIKNFANGKYSDGVYAYKESNNLTLTFENIVLESRTQGLAVQGLTSNSNVNIVNSKITSTEGLGIYYPPKSGTLTITDSEITGVTGIVVKGSNLVVNGEKTIISGTGPNVDPDTYYTGATDDSSSLTETGDALYIESGYNDRDITVAVQGGSFTSANAQAVRMFIQNGEITSVKREVKVTGGTFNTDVSAYVPDGYIYNGETNTVEQLTVNNAVAKIGDTPYKTLADAITAAKGDGKTIVLLKDITATGAISAASGETFTIDLNGHTYARIRKGDVASVYPGIYVNGGNLTIADSSANGTGKVINEVVAGANSGAQSNGAYVSNNGSLTMTGGAIEAKTCYRDSFGVAVFSGSTFTMENGSVSAGGFGITGNGIAGVGNTHVIIKNGTVTGGALGIYQPQNGELIISGGTIIGGTGIEIKSGNVTIEITGNPTISATGTPTHTPSSNGNSTSGYSIAAVENHNYGGSATVSIGSGSYKGEVKILQDNEVEENQKATISITGGLFSSDPSAYCAEGKTGVASGNSQYPYTVGDKDANAKPAHVDTATVPAKTTSNDDTVKNVASEITGANVTNNAAEAATKDLANKNELKGDSVLEDNTTVVGKLNAATSGTTKAENVAIVYQTYVDVVVSDATADSNGKITELEVNLTPMYRVVATTSDVVNGDQKIIVEGDTGVNAVVIQEGKKLDLGDHEYEVKLALPNGFAAADAKLSIKHTKDNGTVEYYTGVVSADGKSVTFTTKGFSPFTISAPAASIDETMYPTLAEAIAKAANGNTIKLEKNCTENVTVSGKSLTINKNNHEYDFAKVTVDSNSTKTVSGEGKILTITYTAPSYSSGSSSDPTYSVSTPSKTEHGTVTVSPKSASKGDTVTVTVKPDSGYVLETLTVTDKNGNELTLKDKGNGKYTFTMPAGKVEVKATFMEDNSMLNFFYDVPNNAYFYEAVKWAVKNGITTGVGNNLFAPEQPCTRAQIVTFLWRAAGSPEPKGAASGMTDVVSGSYYEKAVAWAIENGITTGTTTSTFSPDATCTRAQAVTFLARALKAKAASAAEFSDVPADSYFADAVAWAAANGVTEGIGGGLFGSDNDCTRGQIVTFLYRAYNK